MGKSLRAVALALVMAVALVVCGCAGGASQGSSPSAQSASTSQTSSGQAPAQQQIGLANGTYVADFDTDSSMFHVNEADDGKGVLTVTDEGATIHVHLVSKKIVNLYAGLADDAKADAANVIEPTIDTVTYSDGYQEEVHGFDIPVPVLDEEFDVAILGEKGTWYDHKVSVSNPVAE